MPGKELDPRRYRDPRLPDVSITGADAAIKSLWVDRAARWIARQNRGIETWQADTGRRFAIGELVDAYIQIYRIIDQQGNDVGLRAPLYMMEKGASRHEHMATLFYGPPRSRLGFLIKRELVHTQYHL